MEPQWVGTYPDDLSVYAANESEEPIDYENMTWEEIDDFGFDDSDYV